MEFFKGVANALAMIVLTFIGLYAGWHTTDYSALQSAALFTGDVAGWVVWFSANG
jgi:hypothetical protein